MAAELHEFSQLFEGDPILGRPTVNGGHPVSTGPRASPLAANTQRRRLVRLAVTKHTLHAQSGLFAVTRHNRCTVEAGPTETGSAPLPRVRHVVTSPAKHQSGQIWSRLHARRAVGRLVTAGWLRHSADVGWRVGGGGGGGEITVTEHSRDGQNCHSTLPHPLRLSPPRREGVTAASRRTRAPHLRTPRRRHPSSAARAAESDTRPIGSALAARPPRRPAAEQE